VDVAVLGFGPAGLYVAGKLAAEGLDVTLLGSPLRAFPEFMHWETVNEFQIRDFVLNEIQRAAVFSPDFRLTEKTLHGAIINTQALLDDLTFRAARYGADILAEAQVTFLKRGGLSITWLDRVLKVEPEFVVVEASEGQPVPAIRTCRVPTNPDSIEFYGSSGMWVLPAGREAIVEGSTRMAWHKFVNSAILEVGRLQLPPKRELRQGNLFRVGRAAGQVSGPGWLMEEGLYAGKMLAEALIQHFEGSESAESGPDGAGLETYTRYQKKELLKTFLGSNPGPGNREVI